LAFCRYAEDGNIDVGRPRAAERVLASITTWMQTHLRLEVNATQSGVGRPWERKFLGFTINPKGKIEVAPQSGERFEQKVRERWHDWRGRLRKLRQLGRRERLAKVAHSGRGAWRMAASPSLQTALSNAVLRRWGFVRPSDLASP
jgi:hypothetical protein